MISNLLNLISLFVVSNFVEDDKLIYRVNLFNSRYRTSQNYIARNNWNSSLAVDGDIDTCALIRSDPEKNDPSWWKIELDRIYNITHVRLLINEESIEMLLVSYMQVIVSNDRDNRLCTWLRNKFLKYTNGYKDLDCLQTVSGKYITIKKFDGWIFLCEVEVYADLKSVNLAYKRPLAQRAFLVSDKSFLSVDGDPLTCGVIKSVAKEFPWLRVVLDNTYYVTDITYSFKKPKTDKWYVEKFVIVNLSDNVENFDEGLCSRSPQNYHEDSKGKSLSIKCDKPMPARFVTIRKYSGKNPKILVICDVEVYSRAFPHKMSNITSPDCYPYEYKCLEGGCIHTDWLCDGTSDCPLADDEAPSCEGDESRFKCKRINSTIDIVNRCDGVYNCPDYSDEEHCFAVYTKYLTATFKGQSNLYICSDSWDVKYSENICKQYDRNYVGTNYVPYNNANTFIKVNFFRILSNDTSLMSLFDRYFSSSRCSTKKIVNVRCAYNPDSSKMCGKRYLADAVYEPYIIKGHEPRPGAWPWHVQIFYGSSMTHPYCGGSLIGRRWVLTAAHCLEVNNITNIYVIIGSNVPKYIYTKRYYASHAIPHPSYRSSRSTFDIGLIRLKSRVTLTRHIRTICLPNAVLDNRTLMSYRHCMVAGFGLIDRDGGLPNYIQQARFNYIESGMCVFYISSVSDINPYALHYKLEMDKTFCGGQIPLVNGSNACKGDSGSPWMCKANNGIWTQVGVTTSGFIVNNQSCSGTKFLPVGYYLEFISETMKKTFKESDKTNQSIIFK